jgi:WhiB family redox-sensing transcriptional regulator
MAKTRREEWRDFAKCKRYPIDIFFFETENGRYSTKKINKAKEFCSECKVQPECLSYALNENIEHGVWGGFSSRERNSIKKVYNVIDYSEIVPIVINKTITEIKKNK